MVERNIKRFGQEFSRRLLPFVFFVTFCPLSVVACGEVSPAEGGHTGPDVGQTIPIFEAVDQNGRNQTFETIRGPRGALIVFYRSADW